MANTNTNIIGLTKKGQYEYKYIWVDKNGKKCRMTNI